MRKKLALAAIIGMAFVWYAGSPAVALKQIAEAVSSRDAKSLAERVDIPMLKRSLVEQVASGYLRLTGKDKGLSPIEIQLAVRAASGMANSRVDEMMKPEALIELLNSSGAGGYGDLQLGVPRLEAPNTRNLYRFMLNTEYSGRDFSIIVPFSADEHTGYRLRLRLENWQWKLIGIGLPEAIQIKIASQISMADRKS